MSLSLAMMIAAMKGEELSPKISESSNYKHWISIKDPRRCERCASLHGKIWLISETPDPEPPIHERGRCVIELMQTIAAGTATINGILGADWSLKYDGELPDYYISEEELKLLGWQKGNKISKFVKDKTLMGGVYDNVNNHLPQAPGRVWQEADINYKDGKRNSQRIVWSNDGLIFVTYDHYETFYEII